MKRVTAVLLVLSLALTAAGIYVATRLEGPPEDTTAALVPAEITAYASFFVDPSSAQKRLLRDRVEEAGEEADVGSLVEDVLDRVTRSYGIPYEDVAPWIDRQMALFVMPRGDAGAVVVEVGDEGAARAAMERVNGAVLGDHAVFGDEPAVRASVQLYEDGPDRSLIGPDSMNFADMMEDVPEDRLAVAFAGGGLSSRAANLPPPLDLVELPLGVAQGNAVALRATEAGLAFDGYSYSDGAALLLSGRGVPLKDLGEVPGDSWFAGIVVNLNTWFEGLARELRQAGYNKALPRSSERVVKAIEPTDQTVVWVGGDSLSSLFAGVDVTTSEEGGALLARALADLPALQPRFDFRSDGLVATLGAEREGRLGSNSRFREATGWLGSLHPIGYLDLARAGGVPEAIALLAGTRAGRTAGFTLPGWFGDLDRVVVGMNEGVAPTHWRVVVSLGV